MATPKLDRARDTAKPFSIKTQCLVEIHPLLHEFETIDPALLEGMNGEQRRHIADAFWNRSDPQKRMGDKAETFIEFDQRVSSFVKKLSSLPDQTVMFGHGM